MDGKKVRAARLKAELTLRELAAKSGVSRALICEIEANRANPTIENLEKLARALNTTIDAFFEG